MNILRFFTSSKPKQESNDSVKIYLDDEIRRHQVMPLDNDTTAESIINTLLQQTNLERLHHSPNIKNLYLLLMIRSSKNNTLILKRRINPFESIKEIATFKTNDQEYIWILKQLETTDLTSSMSGGVLGSEPFEPVFYENYRKANEPEKYERSGRLFKKTKNGDYKEKEFVLYKDNLIYFKPGEKHKKVSVIPLVDSRAERSVINPKEKNTFEIKTPDQVFSLKAKSEVDMKGWIAAFNSQAAIATENTIMNNIDKEIRNQEYKFEKSRNEEINLLVGNFEKYMERTPFRHLLIDFLSSDNACYKKLEPVVDTIYAIKSNEGDQEKLNEDANTLLEMLDSLKKPTQEIVNEEKQEKEAEEQAKEGDVQEGEAQEKVQEGELKEQIQEGEPHEQGQEEVRDGVQEMAQEGEPQEQRQEVKEQEEVREEVQEKAQEGESQEQVKEAEAQIEVQEGEAQEKVQEEENQDQNFYDRLLKKEAVETLKTIIPQIREEFTEERKEQLLNSVQDIKNGLIPDLEENYKRLVMGDTLFQERMTDLVKKPHYLFHNYKKCTLFDGARRETRPANSATQSQISNSSNQNSELSFVVSSANLSPSERNNK